MATPSRLAYRAVATSLIVSGVTWLLWTRLLAPADLRECHPPLIMWIVVTLIGVVMLITRRNRNR